MSKKFLLKISAALLVTVGMTGFVFGQDNTKTTTTTVTVEKTVQNPDGTYTVIEYPVGKEIVIELLPTTPINNFKGAARVMRMDDGTVVNLDLSGLDANSNYFVYAVDPAGKANLLGPLTIENGIAKTSFRTPLNQFMLVLSPTEGLTTIGNDTVVAFRSNVPEGHAVVPTAITSVPDNRQVAESTPVSSTYQVPLLGIPSFTKTAEIRINFSGELEGLKGKAYVDPTKNGLTKIKMRFDDMKMAPKNARFVLWASSPDGKYTKLGQVINNGQRQEAEIRSETALQDFGLFVTVEETDVIQPTGKIYSVFSR
ncbi:MAG TPA: hypothetical protein VK892_06820 [Pyrinomonadaceae bacterium]|nr:hypothetical protein [Pyrinomonadaceae bacterium]